MTRDHCDYCGTQGPTEALALREEDWWMGDVDSPGEDDGPRLVCTATSCRQQAIAEGVLPFESPRGEQAGLVSP